MTNDEVKSIVLQHVQHVKETTLIDVATTTNIPLIRVQWAAKILEEERSIVSEKTEAGKVVRLVEKQAASGSTPASEQTQETKAASAQQSPKQKVEKAEKNKKQEKTGRDTTKYIFERSEPMPKGQTVLAILKAFFRDKKPTLKQVKEAFDDSIVQRYGVTQELSVAKSLSGDGRDRFFMKPDQILVTKDLKKLACTSQWTSERFDDVLKAARKVGYTVKAVA